MDSIRRFRARYRDERGGEHTLEYELLAQRRRGRRCYGVSVRDLNGGEAQVWDVTTRPERAEEVFELLVRGLVTPVTLRDVVEDLL